MYKKKIVLVGATLVVCGRGNELMNRVNSFIYTLADSLPYPDWGYIIPVVM